MSSSFVARLCGMYRLLTTYISCMLLMTTAEMSKTVSPTCEDLVCENSNVCQSSLVNDTHAGYPYCSCRGEWAGLRCELKLFVSAQAVTSQTVVMKLHGRPWPAHMKPGTSNDLFVSEATIAIWNFNVSDQCLLLQQNMSGKNSIILTSLDRQQEYLVCIANGLVDSCSFFQQQPSNIPKLSTCIYFETKLFDVEPFDVGFFIVPSAIVIFLVVIIIFVYCQRHSLLVQLCLDRVCCRSCYCLRKHLQRRQCLTYRQSDVSGEMLMPGDVSMDFESVTEAHIRATEESNGVRTYSSNASSSSPLRSACSLEPEGSVSIPTSLDHNIFLYENQSLVPPLYSPQDHKVMTLTYIDDDLIPLNTEHDIPNHTDTIFPEPFSAVFFQDQARKNREFANSKFGCDISKAPSIIPGSDHQKITPFKLHDTTLIKEPTCSSQYTGPVKQQLLVHPYLHRPYHKNHSFHRSDHSNHTSSQFPHNDHGVTFRKENFSALRQRPLSLPVAYLCQNTPGIGEFPSSNGTKHCLKSQRKSSLKDTCESTFLPSPARSSKNNSENQVARSNSDTDNIKINHFLCNPTCHKCTMNEGKQSCVPIYCDNSANENCTSNTLPRSKKPRFVQPNPRNSIQDSLLNSSFGNHQKSMIAVPPQRPTWLNISNPIQKPNSLNLTQETNLSSAETSISSESKSQSKSVRSLKSHLENNLPFLKSSKSNRPTEEEKEYQDLLSPLAAERLQASKKSRHSNSRKTSSGKKRTSSTEIHKRDSTCGLPVFEGHPSEHIIPPFDTDNQDDGEDLSDHSIRNDKSERNSIASNSSKSGSSVISSFEDDDTNLVTPFDSDNSSDDTYKGIQSLTASNDTLQDLQAELSLFDAEDTLSCEHLLMQNGRKASFHSEESDKLLNQ